MSLSQIMKHSSRIMFILTYIFAVTVIVNCEDEDSDEIENYFEDKLNPEEIVNPHSFYYDKQNKKMIDDLQVDQPKNILQENNIIQSDLKSSKQAENYSTHEGVFYKRLINLLLTNIHIQDKDDISITGILEIELSHSEMEILQNFHVQKTSFREIDEILSNVIKKPRYNYRHGIMFIFEMLQNVFGMILMTIEQHQDAAMIVFSMSMVMLTFRMMRWHQRLPIFSLLQIIFVLSFFMTWWQLIQDAEIKYTAAQMKYKGIPISCQPDKMNMWDKVVSFFSNDDCEQYYKVVMTNPKLKITPAFALSHFITTVILHPITHVGTIVSHFVHNATDNLPWTYGWIVRCMLYLCIGFVIIMIPFCLSGASFNLGLGPLLRFGISYGKEKEKGNSTKHIQNREPVQVILQVTQDTKVPQIKNTSETEQSKAPQAIENQSKDVTRTDSDSEECCSNQPCGDTIINTKLSESGDEENKKSEELNTVQLEKHAGSGDA